jgi:L-ascorbate metabolism protein UlaG (beta-lactamase superfamily)
MSQTLLIALIVIAVITASCATLRVPTHKGEVSDHFDGKKFYNPEGPGLGKFIELMKYNRQNKKGKWEKQVVESPINDVIEDFDEAGKIRYFHVNHATVLIQMDGMNILTDPVYSQRASPFSWAGPVRFRDPGIPLDFLPRIDVVVISHDHYDHLDINTLKKLRDKDNPTMYVGLGLKAFFKKFKLLNVEELDWNQSTKIKDIEITFTEAIHWSNRAFSPRKTLWGGYVIKGSSRIYFAGDTAYGPHFAEAREIHGPFDLALIPIGAYVPRFFMSQVHMDPQQAAQTHLDLDPKKSLAIHWGTFQLTHEAMFDPIKELQITCDSLQIDNFHFDHHPGVQHIAE